MQGWRISAITVLFIGLVATALTVMLSLVPLGEIPDEMSHIMRADGLRHGEIVGRRGTSVHKGMEVRSAGVLADPALGQAGYETDFGKRELSRETLAKSKAATWSAPVYIHAPNTAVYGPAFYVPAGLTIAVAKAMGGTPHDALIAARTVNALLYVAIGALGLALACRGRALLLIILGLPMSLSLAPTVNQDGLIIATCVLMAALFTRIDAGKGEKWAYGLFCFLMLIIFMAKPPYLPLAALLLIPAWQGWQQRRENPAAVRGQLRLSLWGFGLVVVPALAWIIYNMVWVSAPFTKEFYQSGPLSGVSETLYLTAPGWQARILLSEPWRLISIPYDTIVEYGRLWWMQLIGVLGPNAYLFSQSFYDNWGISMAAILLVALLPAGFVPRAPRLVVAERATYLLLLIGCAWLIIIAQYLSWTEVGAVLVDGVQGRYFIPLLPFLALLFPRQPASPTLGTLAQLAALILTLVGVFQSTELLIRSYYLH
ncbi:MULTISPECIES: DUF2142 domain-containing protein [unclassified Azospirillum]|uniref:DUF2142 domain-containing protein n=1 Tax=unclassified Azospirillum TaxID=2630922 RepID=UPI000B68EEE0|nr:MULTISPECIES: DUF2142 domain-containing protein [unclassified Azospirillum]SNR83425.1 Uncharacterized membrane protein [Azospirillum sp. RU38E]SNR98949.1 Uncharacterized membrane protein [Azospirillum sp. RU37A]